MSSEERKEKLLYEAELYFELSQDKKYPAYYAREMWYCLMVWGAL